MPHFLALQLKNKDLTWQILGMRYFIHHRVLDAICSILTDLWQLQTRHYMSMGPPE